MSALLCPDDGLLLPGELVADGQLLPVALVGVQGPAGPPGPSGSSAIAPPRPIAPGDLLPVEALGTLCWSTISPGLLIYIDADGTGARWISIGTGGGVVTPPDATILLDDSGQQLVNDLGEVLHSG